ncbi:MAG: type II toxin-antitoxin system RelE/ParE family toxin [Candidatus Eremiobacteraeota bacterium]|nr:type II toxin-antitoxin system RelE/ParE family toxin [Candidatus Eremiobacteraeota bacterium]
MKVRYLREALLDLDDIAFYISLENPDAARRTVGGIIARLRVLSSFPGAGRERNDLYPGLRSWPINSYVVFYTVTKSEVRISRILHGRRDLYRTLNEGD